MKFLKYGLVGLIIFIAGVIALFAKINSDFSNEYYFLDVVNAGTTPATLTISQSDGKWTIGAGESKTIKVEKQKRDDISAERTFSVANGQQNQTVKGRVHYSGHTVLDLTGSACIVAADYGPQYRPKDAPFPPGESDIKVLKVYKGSQVFDPAPYDTNQGKSEFYISTPLGDPLPEKIQITPGKVPQHVRLICVPCGILDNPKELYEYLNKH